MRSVKVKALEVSLKSQLPSATIPVEATFFTTSLNLTLGLIVIAPSAKVLPLKRAAEIYFPANSPA